jgi:hypothetical protein
LSVQLGSQACPPGLLINDARTQCNVVGAGQQPGRRGVPEVNHAITDMAAQGHNSTVHPCVLVMLLSEGIGVLLSLTFFRLFCSHARAALQRQVPACSPAIGAARQPTRAVQALPAAHPAAAV